MMFEGESSPAPPGRRWAGRTGDFLFFLPPGERGFGDSVSFENLSIASAQVLGSVRNPEQDPASFCFYRIARSISNTNV